MPQARDLFALQKGIMIECKLSHVTDWPPFGIRSNVAESALLVLESDGK